MFRRPTWLLGLFAFLSVVAAGETDAPSGPRKMTTGYDYENVIKSDTPPADMPIRYDWRVKEKRLYAIPPRSRIRRVIDPKAPAWANDFFRLRQLYGDLVYLYMSFWKPSEKEILRHQNTWQMSGWVDYYLLTG